jgi:transposase
MDFYQKKYLELEKKLNNLTEENKKLKLDYNQLKSNYEKLELDNKKLKTENNELKEKLGLNSKNSSIPSSKEMYKQKREESRPKSDRNPGGQKGHKGTTRSRMEPNKVVDMDIPEFCECGGHIQKFKKRYIHQKVDIPPIVPEVTDYRLEQGRCSKCGKRIKAKLPEGVSKNTFGPHIESIIAALTGYYKNSKSEVANILSSIFNLQISIASVSNIEARVSGKCEESYKKIWQDIVNQSIVHIDETSHYTKSKLCWNWTFATKDYSFVKIEQSRGKKVLENSGLNFDKSTIVTDRYAAYNYFRREQRQICWAHLARDFERLANSQNENVRIKGINLRDLTIKVFELKNKLQKDKDLEFFKREVQELRKTINENLKNIVNFPDALRASNVAKNILKVEDMMWKFLSDPFNIPMTNNYAERQIRHYVIYRKNSYFTQSERGNRFLERIISLYLTWKQQNLNPYQQLLHLLL